MLANIKNRNKMKKLLSITLLLLTLIACQDDSRVDNLHREMLSNVCFFCKVRKIKLSLSIIQLMVYITFSRLSKIIQ